MKSPKVSESRKIRKPLIEKKRRARINDSLETLKQILLESKTYLKEGKKGQRYSKLEKADILELTVTYLQQLHGKFRENRIDSDDKENDNHSNKKSLADEENFVKNNTIIIRSDRKIQPSFVRKEPVLIRPADSSSENVKIGVTLFPTRLHSGHIVYFLPKNLGEKSVNGHLVESKEKVWRPW
ncbi:unnamed protein product [Psylliodes chrysocephalus]|uniref:BHLH domain-containing protein n=1 Tax=Psylliodes chrysocephalus TaxID=3402493 RepID=A0A9P0GN80_9CUCU|nr:unnamed protein product [Psylliodes chrysocephala]